MVSTYLQAAGTAIRPTYKGFEDQNALMVACEKGHTTIVDLLKKHGFDLNTTDDNNRTPLMRAVQREDARMVEHLLAYHKKKGKLKVNSS